MFNIAEEKPAKRKSNGRVPQAYPTPKNAEEKSAIGNAIRKLLPIYKMPRVKSDEELEERLADFFTYCANNDVVPTVEAMWMYCGYYRGWAYDIESGRSKGFSSDTSVIVKKAKEFLSGYDAEMVATGKLNPVVYIFRGKNYYGLKDQQEVNLTANSSDDVNADDIRDKYIKEHYPIETSAKEVEN